MPKICIGIALLFNVKNKNGLFDKYNTSRTYLFNFEKLKRVYLHQKNTLRAYMNSNIEGHGSLKITKNKDSPRAWECKWTRTTRFSVCTQQSDPLIFVILIVDDVFLSFPNRFGLSFGFVLTCLTLYCYPIPALELVVSMKFQPQSTLWCVSTVRALKIITVISNWPNSSTLLPMSCDLLLLFSCWIKPAISGGNHFWSFHTVWLKTIIFSNFFGFNQ